TERGVGVAKPTLDLLRAARSRPRVYWSLQYNTPLIDLAMPRLAAHRELTKLLRLKAQVDHDRGADAEFIRDLEDILALADAIDHQPTLIAHLIATAANENALGAIETTAPFLAVTADANATSNGPASRASVEQLIATLLDDAYLADGLKRSFEFERAIQLDCTLIFAEGRFGNMSGANSLKQLRSPLPWLTAPLFKLDGVSMLEYMAHEIEAVQEPTYAAYQACIGKYPAPPWVASSSTWVKVQHFLATIIMPSLQRAVVLHYRLLALRRLAAVALAVRLYAVDHGARPAALADLVPDYLAAIPADPFSSNGVILYAPEDAHPHLYSVGVNGVDDGGAFTFKRESIDYDGPDLPFFLDTVPQPGDE
ncbi:MAG TPA: hypothetical protein P5572_04180, partial [Phycisphaerae bacterium]|nr:hypothetical protein [Phycisphaerae bacterium]